jgi:hypothetical protein
VLMIWIGKINISLSTVIFIRQYSLLSEWTAICFDLNSVIFRILKLEEHIAKNNKLNKITYCFPQSAFKLLNPEYHPIKSVRVAYHLGRKACVV